jgi:hypothetical protein
MAYRIQHPKEDDMNPDIDRSHTFALERDWRVWYAAKFLNPACWIAVALSAFGAAGGSLTPKVLGVAVMAASALVLLMFTSKDRLRARWEHRVGEPQRDVLSPADRRQFWQTFALSVVKTRLLVTGAFGGAMAWMVAGAPNAAGETDWRLVAGTVAAFLLVDLVTDADCWRTEFRVWLKARSGR